jgi:hypothetical protein
MIGKLAKIALFVSTVVLFGCGDSDEPAHPAAKVDASADSRMPPGNDAAPQGDGGVDASVGNDAGPEAQPDEDAADAGADADPTDASVDGEGGLPSDVAGPAGGTVGDAGGTITLVIPPGALAGETRFSFTPLSSLPGLSPDYILRTGTAYRINWTGAGFTANAVVTIRFRPPLPLIEELGSDYLEQPGMPGGVAVMECDDVIEVTSGYDAQTSGFICQHSDGAPAQSVSAGLVTPQPTVVAPAITAQPADASVSAGSQVSFRVTATGGGLSYQWRRNGVAIPGARSTVYGFEAATGDNGAKFSVVVKNILGTLTSTEALLSTGPPVPPAAPNWSARRELAPFGTGIDLPQLGAGTVWRNGSLLQAYAYPSLAQPTRTRPIVLSGPNRLSSYIVFVDDDGTGNCSIGGNRLSVIGAHVGSEGQTYPLSQRFTLYSTTDCINQFAAGRAPKDLDPAKATLIVFALTEASSGQLKVGAGGPYFQPNFADGGGSWVETPRTDQVLDVDPACAPTSLMIAEGMMGVDESQSTARPATTAVVAWIAGNANLCAATLDNGVWSRGARLFDAAAEAEASVAIDGNSGSVLVLGSRLDSTLAIPKYRMTAAFRPAGGGAWQIDALDQSDAVALANAAFSTTGAAHVVWRPNLATPPTTVYASRRPRNGTWEPAQPISSATAADTRFPRICVDTTGAALALYSEQSGTENFKVWSRLWKNGAWSAPSAVQDNTNEGRFARCVRHSDRDFQDILFGLSAVWRETDPNDATRFRIMSAR